MYGSIFIHIYAVSGLQNTHLFCTTVRFGRSRSFRGIQGRWFCYQSKARIRLPIVCHCNYGHILHRFWDTATYWLKIAYFGYIFAAALSFGALAPMFPLEFRAEVNRQETIVMGISSSEDRMIVARVVLAWYQRVTDAQTVGRSDGQTESIMANTALCIASYADAL